MMRGYQYTLIFILCIVIGATAVIGGACGEKSLPSNQERITLECFRTGTNLNFISSLWPDYILQLPSSCLLTSLTDVVSLSDMLCFPVSIRAVCDASCRLFSENGIHSVSGFYSGDAFDMAHEESSLELKRDEILSFITRLEGLTDEYTPNEGLAFQKCNNIVIGLFRGILSRITDERTVLSWKIYDKGQYHTLQLNGSSGPAITLSLDFSGKKGIRIVTARGSGDTTYYEAISCVRKDDATEYAFSLYNSEAPVFQTVQPEEKKAEGKLRLSGISGSEIAIEADAHLSFLKQPVTISGIGNPDKNGKTEISADVSYGDEKRNVSFQFEKQTSNRSVPEQKVLSLSKEEDRKMIFLSLMQHLSPNELLVLLSDIMGI